MNVVFFRAELILGKDIIHLHFLLLITGHHIILGLDLKEAVTLRVERFQPVEAVLSFTFTRKWTVVTWRVVGTLVSTKTQGGNTISIKWCKGTCTPAETLLSPELMADCTSVYIK